MFPRAHGLAVVTGASSGIGREIARQLAARGQPVLAIARRLERLEALAAEARAAGHAAIHPLSLDLTSHDAPEKIRDRARELGGARWLVNDAGAYGYGRFEKQATADALNMIRLNCLAPVLVTRALVADLRANAPSVILNVSSLAAFQPDPGYAVYGATKTFLLSFSEALKEELRGSGVSVTALCPGPVTTEILDHGNVGAPRTPPPYELDPATTARIAIDAADAGRTVSVPGLMNRISAFAAGLTPRGILRRISRQVATRYIGLPPV